MASMVNYGETTGGLAAKPGEAPVLWVELGPTKVLGAEKGPVESMSDSRRRKSLKSSSVKGVG